MQVQWWDHSDWLVVALKQNVTQIYLSGWIHTEHMTEILQHGDVAQMVERSLSM